MTIFSGVSHPGVDGGHAATQCFLTAPRTPSAAFKNSVSLDQVAAERMGAATRFPVLVTRVGNREPEPVVHARRRDDPGRKEPGRPLSEDVRQGTAKQMEARIERPEDRPQHRSTSSTTAPRDFRRTSGRGSRPPRPVLHERPRPGEPADQGPGVGEAAQAQGQASPEPTDAEKGQLITASRLMFDTGPAGSRDRLDPAGDDLHPHARAWRPIFPAWSTRRTP